MNIPTLEKDFKSDTVLYASELNAIVKKLNEVIGALANVETGGGKGAGITQEDVKNKIAEETKKLKDQIAELNAKYAQILIDISKLPDGNTEIDTEDEYTKNLKITDTINKLITDVFITLKLLDEDGNPNPEFAIGLLKEQLSDLSGKIETVSTGLTGYVNDNEAALGLIANVYDKETGKPLYNGAEVMLAINRITGESSIGINADKIRVNGEVTLNQKLQAMDVDIAGKLSAGYVETFQMLINGKADIEALEALTGNIGSLQADVANIRNLTVTEQTVNRLIVDKLSAADLNLTGTFSTGTTGHVAKLYTNNNAGVLRMYDTNTPSTSSVLITDTQDGGSIVLSSPNFNVANRTGWQLTIGYSGISMQSYVRGKLSEFYLSPDMNAGQNTAVINGISFRVWNSDNTLQDQRILRVDE